MPEIRNLNAVLTTRLSVRTSTRIASMSRTVSYANLAGGSDLSDSADDSFSSRGEEAEEDWEGSDQSGVERRKGGPRSNAGKHRSWGGGKTKPRVRRIGYSTTIRSNIDHAIPFYVRPLPSTILHSAISWTTIPTCGTFTRSSTTPVVRKCSSRTMHSLLSAQSPQPVRQSKRPSFFEASITRVAGVLLSSTDSLLAAKRSTMARVTGGRSSTTR